MDEEPLQNLFSDLDPLAASREPRLVSLLCCDLANETVEHKQNLIGTFDRLRVARPDDGPSPAFVLFVRLANVGRATVGLGIFGPTGTFVAGGTVEAQDNPMAAAGDDVVMTQFVLRMSFKLAGEGRYWVAVVCEGKLLGGTPLWIERLSDNDDEGAVDGER